MERKHNPGGDTKSLLADIDALLAERPVSRGPVPERLEGNTPAERHPDWPPLHLTIYLSGHQSAADWEGAKPLFGKADIYLMEAANNVPEFFTDMQRHADTPKDVIVPWMVEDVIQRNGFSGSPDEVMFRNVIGTGLALGEFDLQPGDDVTWQEIVRAEATPIDYSGTFDDCLDAQAMALVSYGRLQRRRDEIMADRLESELDRLINSRGGLKMQPQLEALITMGALHTHLVDLLREKGYDLDVQLSRGTEEEPYEYSYTMEAAPGAINGGEPPNRDHLAKVYLERRIVQLVKGTISGGVPEDDMTPYARSVASAFEIGEIERIFERDQTRRMTQGELSAIMEKKGLRGLPMTTSELKRFR